MLTGEPLYALLLFVSYLKCCFGAANLSADVFKGSLKKYRKSTGCTETFNLTFNSKQFSACLPKNSKNHMTVLLVVVLFLLFTGYHFFTSTLTDISDIFFGSYLLLFTNAKVNHSFPSQPVFRNRQEDSGVSAACSENTVQTEDRQQTEEIYCIYVSDCPTHTCVFKLLPPRSVTSGGCSSAVVSVFFLSGVCGVLHAAGLPSISRNYWSAAFDISIAISFRLRSCRELQNFRRGQKK